MKKILSLFIVISGIFLFACDDTSKNADSKNKEKTETKIEETKTEESKSTFTVKIDGEDKEFTPTSSWATHWEKTFSYPKEGETKNTINEKSSHTEIMLANYELDSKDGKFSLNKQKIEKPEQMRIEIALNGEKGTDSETPIKIGKYEVNTDSFNLSKAFGKIDSVEIAHLVDGKHKESSLTDSKMKGSIEITEVSENTIIGKIDITDGKHTIKGDFTAKGENTVK